MFNHIPWGVCDIMIINHPSISLTFKQVFFYLLQHINQSTSLEISSSDLESQT